MLQDLTNAVNNGKKSNGCHVVLKNDGKKATRCYLWLPLVHRKSRSENGAFRTYSCATCGHGFHENGFTFFHNMSMLQRKRLHSYIRLLAAKENEKSASKRDHIMLHVSSVGKALVLFELGTDFE